MPRKSNIPTELEPSIIKRWLTGWTAPEILEWIEEENITRAIPVETSYGGVVRVIRKWEGRNPEHARHQVVRRIRARSPQVLEALEALEQSLAAEIEVLKLPGATVDMPALRARMVLVGKLEMLFTRRLKMAGVTGKAGDEVLAQYDDFARRCYADVLAQDARSELGIPPEQGDPPLEVTQPMPQTDRPEPTPADLIESITRNFKQIDTSIRSPIASQSLRPAPPSLRTAPAAATPRVHGGLSSAQRSAPPVL